MKAQRGTNNPIVTRISCAIFLTSAVVILAAGTASAALTVETSTGVRANIHTAEDILDHWLVTVDGRTVLRHPVAGELELDTALYPWSDLVPVGAEMVADAVRSLQGFQTDIDVEIFLLPGFPADVLSSFARRESVFLAPGLGVQAPETVAYVTTHELGHVFCWAALDGRSGRWAAYRQLRGLDLQDDAAAIAHADRNREILAEDFRFLFGGRLATVSGTIENAGLTLPSQVHGLDDLLAGYLADSNGDRTSAVVTRVYPNPCRDLAVVEMDLDDTANKSGDGALVLEIYDVRGRLVRRLEDGRIAAGRATSTWDGNGTDGRRAAAGIYFYRIRHGVQNGSGRLLLLAR